ncbi:hypothetical protein CAOG_03647 [Capsaspora owczarzaki ATCC 30864]|uniref:Major facilitator superfamily (MFS) profile domain-containing protein n=1 Tax=Capsaspora owczarzaki (strain ATCC 30864) TaxID=595528 RepID=A0A0D2VQ70_CAPO3|nr:hypothetical protein CAOG_03647 [Capsaspora owczarzaki ATCC 30864]KJE92737.1 hypothetical protein CAOG_003647 [Capsaspora owczarzaki ATCC 30864]|eukprot:XP_004363375.1 hypothetical protein CAOG_03647 [Capsaspora owczarzaki ATCC 30864]
MVSINLRDPVRRMQMQVIVATWFAYAATYLLRKPVSVVKNAMAEELQMSTAVLGLLDTAFLMPYAALQLVIAPFADRVGARRILTAALIGAAVSMFALGWQSNQMVILLMLFGNGLSQSSSWPSCVKALAPWIPEENRGVVFGLWGTCQSIGGVLGTLIAVHQFQTGTWRDTFFLPSAIVFVIGVAQFFLTKTPQEAHMQPPNERAAAKALSDAHSVAVVDKITLWEAIKIPTFVNVCTAFFSVKLVRYCLLMWLPMYFLKHLNFDIATAGVMSTTFELGGAIGTPFIGLLSDRVFHGKKLATTFWSQTLSGVFLVFFIAVTPYSRFLGSICMGLVGVFSTGPDMMITGPIATELGEYQGRNVQASVAGFINGLGGIGAVIQGPLIGGIADFFGWSGVLMFIMVLSFFAAACLLPALRYERRRSMGLGTG